MDVRTGPRFSTEPSQIPVLVIEDEKVARLALTRLLIKAGYLNVFAVSGAKEGLELLEKHSDIKLIICDVKMPDMNGIDFLSTLAKKEGDIPVVMASGTKDLEVVYQCLQKGAVDFLIKPVTIAALSTLWRNVYLKNSERTLLKNVHHEQAELHKEIASLESRLADAVITPIKAISNTVSNLLTDGNLNESTKDALSQILKTLHDSNLMRGAVESFVLSSDESNSLDHQTREWLKNELKLSSLEKSTSKVHRTQPLDSATTQHLRSYDFDVWHVTDDETFFSLIVLMFDDFHLFETFAISRIHFQEFLSDIRSHYRDKNPYHNWRHAFDVTHMIYIILTNAKGCEFLGPVEILSILLAGLIHDLAHPGTNNTFQILTDSELALTYNDQSVLENYHCSLGFRLFKKHCLLEKVPPHQRRTIRNLIVQCVLATDMSKHMGNLTDFEKLVETTTLDPEQEEHRKILAKMVMKSSDLSNPARPFIIAKYWAIMVQEEFFQQGDQEKELGLPFSAFCERGNSSLAQMQINFADFVVLPTFKAVSKVLPGINDVIIPTLLSNRVQWEKLKESEKKSEIILRNSAESLHST